MRWCHQLRKDDPEDNSDVRTHERSLPENKFEVASIIHKYKHIHKWTCPHAFVLSHEGIWKTKCNAQRIWTAALDASEWTGVRLSSGKEPIVSVE